MNKPFPVLLVVLLFPLLQSPVPAQFPQTGVGSPSAPTNTARFVHDPCIIRDGAYYYVFATGPGIPFRRSKDLKQWETMGRVFMESVPAWAKMELPDSRGIWAPDISFYKGRFHLYYTVSTFGKNHSLIGTASSKTLDPASKEYQWADEGKVWESTQQDNYNAIDPNILPLTKDRLALTFGSFWSGIKLIYLDAHTGKPLSQNNFQNANQQSEAAQTKIISLAQRPPPDALEAPFLIKHGKYFYLFVSFDFCCRGVNSTYNIRVGRAARVEGPYLDRDNKPLLDGGGTPVLASQGSVAGPGHCAILHDAGKDYLAYHFYDKAANGVPTLQIRPLTWTSEGWPEPGLPLDADAPSPQRHRDTEASQRE